MPKKITSIGLENFVSAILIDRGYLELTPKRFSPMQALEQPIFARQFEAGKDIYGKKRRVDIILYHPDLHPNCLAIQCKWQYSRGSVEEKYPFEVLNIEQSAYDTIIILDGGGYSAGAKQWLSNQCQKTKLLHVLNQEEFSLFANSEKV